MTRKIFDMNQCNPGDLLISKHGWLFEYLGIRNCPSDDPFRHRVRYPDSPEGTRTDEGWVFRNRPLPEDHDIIGFAHDIVNPIETIDEIQAADLENVDNQQVENS